MSEKENGGIETYPKPIARGSIRMSVDGIGITQMVRDVYWWEQERRPWVYNVLRCFEGMNGIPL